MIDAESQMIESLYIEMFHKLFLYAKCTLQNNSLSEEAVQETFRIACTKPEALCGSENPKGWLLNTLKHVISNTVRNHKSTSKLLSDYITTYAKEIAATHDGFNFEILYEDIAELEEYQLIKEMVVDGKSYFEMAESRGISIVACRKRVQRAKEVLKSVISSGITPQQINKVHHAEGGF